MADTINIIVNGVDNASGALGRVGGSLQALGTKMMGVGAATTAMTAPLALLGAASITTAGDFEASMNILSVAARSSETSLADLSAAALQVGADTELVGISASQAGEAMTDMYKAGLTTNQIFGDMQGYLEGTTSLTGALRAAIDLAAASELDLGAATNVVAVAMATFGLDAAQATTIANSFVQTADAGVASVMGLTEAMVNVGPTAAAMGMSLGETNIALALLAAQI
jgi:TP901 family phage tail tape measure protein